MEPFADQYTVFIKDECPWCHKAIDLLEAKGKTYETVLCTTFPDLRDYVYRPASKTFPQIAVNGKVIGGYDALCDMLDEPVLAANPLRFTLFPLRYHDLYECYTKALASFWTPQEISLAEDIQDWNVKLTEDDRFFIKHVLAFFAGSDGIVMENLAAHFAREVQIPEARQFYASQMLMEAVHSETYSLLIDALAAPHEAATLFQAIETMEPVRKKAAWALKYLDPTKRFAERLIAFMCVEGILFSGSFCGIYWLKRRGVMPGLCLSNEFISRDEALHYQFAVKLYSHLKHSLPESVVKKIVTEAVDTELEFVRDAIPVRLIGMNADLMQEYIKFVADRAMLDLGLTKIYNAENPFPWMELISLQGKSNFFERFPSEYQRSGVMADTAEQIFGTDGDF